MHDGVARGKDPEHPFGVAEVAGKIQRWIGRLGEVWIEGQIVQLNRRGTMRTAFATLRDPEANSSLTLTIPVTIIDGLATPLDAGTTVLVHAKPTFWPTRGSFQLAVDDLRPVGVGSLLAQIEVLRQRLAAEGLFDAARKKPIPFIPHLIGLITGRDSDAKKDVLTNARRRWPAARFAIREVAVQGVAAAGEVTRALAELDQNHDVDVIVIARGGGGVEDLLPFSDETLLRAVAAASTTVVSAIGHEADSPLLDHVADLRASTPTDAGKRIVPDLAEEHAGLTYARERLGAAVARRLDREQDRLTHLTTRPALADPRHLITHRQAELDSLRLASHRTLTRTLDKAEAATATLAATLRALSPQATLDRGYAVVRTTAGTIVRESAHAPTGTDLTIKLAHDTLTATTT